MKLNCFSCYSHPALSGYFMVMGINDGRYLVEWFTKNGTYQGNDFIPMDGKFYEQCYEVNLDNTN